MKAKTIARLTRIIIAVVVALIFAVPLLAGANNFQMSSGQIVGTDSTYELDQMSESDISTNITNGVTDVQKDYSISYTSLDGSKKMIYLKFSAMDETQRKTAIQNAATVLKTDHKNGTCSTLLDSEGKVVKQQMIMATDNKMESVMWTGMKLTSSAIKTLSPEVTLNTRNGDELVKISDVDIIPSDDTFIVKIRIPYIVLATAIAQNNNITLEIGLQYNQFFNLDLSLDLPLTMFIGEDAKLPEVKVISPSEVIIDLTLVGLDDMEVTIDKVKITSQDGKLTIKALEGTIVSNLESYRNDNGELEFIVDGDKYILDKEMSDSFIKIVKSIMGGGA